MVTLITGGSGSGKSKFAEELAVTYNSKQLIYIATMIPFDRESKDRIERHKEQRADKNFITMECYTDLDKIELPEGSTVLLECMSNLTANERYRENSEKEETIKRIMRGMEQIIDMAEHVIVVTNEVFSDGIEYEMETVQYLKDLGTINRLIASTSNQVIEIVYGIPIYHKKEEADLHAAI